MPICAVCGKKTDEVTVAAGDHFSGSPVARCKACRTSYEAFLKRKRYSTGGADGSVSATEFIAMHKAPARAPGQLVRSLTSSGGGPLPARRSLPASPSKGIKVNAKSGEKITMNTMAKKGISQPLDGGVLYTQWPTTGYNDHESDAVSDWGSDNESTHSSAATDTVLAKSATPAAAASAQGSTRSMIMQPQRPVPDVASASKPDSEGDEEFWDDMTVQDAESIGAQQAAMASSTAADYFSATSPDSEAVTDPWSTLLSSPETIPAPRATHSESSLQSRGETYTPEAEHSSTSGADAQFAASAHDALEPPLLVTDTVTRAAQLERTVALIDSVARVALSHHDTAAELQPALQTASSPSPSTESSATESRADTGEFGSDADSDMDSLNSFDSCSEDYSNKLSAVSPSLSSPAGSLRVDTNPPAAQHIPSTPSTTAVTTKQNMSLSATARQQNRRRPRTKARRRSVGARGRPLRSRIGKAPKGSNDNLRKLSSTNTHTKASRDVMIERLEAKITKVLVDLTRLKAASSPSGWSGSLRSPPLCQHDSPLRVRTARSKSPSSRTASRQRGLITAGHSSLIGSPLPVGGSPRTPARNKPRSLSPRRRRRVRRRGRSASPRKRRSCSPNLLKFTSEPVGERFVDAPQVASTDSSLKQETPPNTTKLSAIAGMSPTLFRKLQMAALLARCEHARSTNETSDAPPLVTPDRPASTLSAIDFGSLYLSDDTESI